MGLCAGSEVHLVSRCYCQAGDMIESDLDKLGERHDS